MVAKGSNTGLGELQSSTWGQWSTRVVARAGNSDMERSVCGELLSKGGTVGTGYFPTKRDYWVGVCPYIWTQVYGTRGCVSYNLPRGMSGMMRGTAVANRKQKANLYYHTVHPKTLYLRVGAIRV